MIFPFLQGVFFCDIERAFYALFFSLEDSPRQCYGFEFLWHVAPGLKKPGASLGGMT